MNSDQRKARKVAKHRRRVRGKEAEERHQAILRARPDEPIVMPVEHTSERLDKAAKLDLPVGDGQPSPKVRKRTRKEAR